MILQTKQASSLLKKLYDGESLTEEDWYFVATTGMTIAFLLYDNCTVTSVSVPLENSSLKFTSKKKKPKN